MYKFQLRQQPRSTWIIMQRITPRREQRHHAGAFLQLLQPAGCSKLLQIYIETAVGRQAPAGRLAANCDSDCDCFGSPGTSQVLVRSILVTYGQSCWPELHIGRFSV
jgi:hypothetical protein